MAIQGSRHSKKSIQVIALLLVLAGCKEPVTSEGYNTKVKAGLAHTHSGRLNWKKEMQDESLTVEVERVLLTNSPVIFDGSLLDVRKANNHFIAGFSDDNITVWVDVTSEQANELVKAHSGSNWALALLFSTATPEPQKTESGDIQFSAQARCLEMARL